MRAFYDLHIHSCLSPCGDRDMTPKNIAGMAALCGLEVIAVADHNTCGHCPQVAQAAREQGLLAVPAMELTTSEETHILCFLPDLDAAREFSDYVYSKLPDIPNREDIFGEQLVLDGDDNPAGVERRFLLSATSISVYDVAALMREYGGAAVPAHIDRTSFSVLSNLGLWDFGWGFRTYEVYARDRVFPELAGLRRISNSDAHALESMRDAENALDLDRLSARAVIDML
ncbi:MAG: PHP domain-containing protein [Oscillospiraceae bacterium]|nr:PHP domain-containing protein [Oscillospiraceae bacterium]